METKSAITSPRVTANPALAGQKSCTFLHLPQDIRFIIYDCLLLCSHQEVYVTDYMDLEHPTTITLITADPIPPIHQTCRLLNDEAGSFLRNKVKKRSTSRAAPRIIVHAGSIEHILEGAGFIDELLRLVEVIRDSLDQKFMDESEETRLIGRELFFEKDADVVKAFAKRAGKYMRNSGVSLSSWWDEAAKIYEEDHPDRENHLRNSGQEEVYLAEVDRRAEIIRTAAQRGLLHVAVVSDDAKGVKADLPMFVSGFKDICTVHQVRTSLRTFGWNTGEDLTVRVDEWMRFDGQMDKKTWDDEWA